MTADVTNNEGPLLSVVITVHHEGIIAHRTLLSVFRALEPIEAEQISYEIVINIDNGDAETIEYFQRYLDDPRFLIVHSAVSDAGLARNNAFQAARGQYIALIDGDDLVSGNWLIEALRTARNYSQPATIRPEVLLSFPDPDDKKEPVYIRFNSGSGSREYEAIRMIETNPWPDTLLALRDIMLAEPFPESDKQTGFEDFTLTANLIAKGVPTIVVPQTALFYRQSWNGFWEQQKSRGVVFHYSELFETTYMQSIVLPQADEPDTANQPHRNLAYRLIRSLYYTLQKLPIIRDVAYRAYERRQIKIADKSKDQLKQALPAWLRSELAQAARIERRLNPGELLSGDLVRGSVSDLTTGWVYRRLIEGLPPTVDYLIFAPDYDSAKATQMVLAYTQAISQTNPDLRIAVLASGSGYGEQGWRSQLPAGVSCIEYGDLASDLAERAKDILLTRLIVQLKVKNLHIIGSELGYDWASRYSLYIEQTSIKLFASVLNPGSDADTGLSSLDVIRLMRIYPLLCKLTCSGQQVFDELVQHYGMNPSRLACHPLMTDLDSHSGRTDQVFLDSVRQDIII